MAARLQYEEIPLSLSLSLSLPPSLSLSLSFTYLLVSSMAMHCKIKLSWVLSKCYYRTYRFIGAFFGWVTYLFLSS